VKLSIFAVATSGLFLVAPNCDAGILPHHASAVVSGPGGDPWNSPLNTGQFQAAAGASGTVNVEVAGLPAPNAAGTQAASGTAISESNAFGWQLSTSTSYLDSLPPDTAFPLHVGVVSAVATWQDILFLSNVDPTIVGHTVRLSFSATGASSVQPGDTGKSGTGSNGLFDEELNSARGWSRSTVNPNVQTNAFITIGQINVSEGWDSLTREPNGTFFGTWHLDIPILPVADGGGFIPGDPGSVKFEVSAESSSGGPSNFSPGGQANGSDPVHFLSVTLPDVGNVTPEALGVSVAFDSGIASPNIVVPEPSTFLISLILMVTFGLGRLLRRFPPIQLASSRQPRVNR
jgi:hypothetical protein